MARIQFSSTVEEFVGKLAGSVFQDSYMGMQVRGLPKPKNPQTQLQQLRRGRFGFLAESWRFLSDADKSTWEATAGTIPEALRLFIGSNINLLLIGLSVINSYNAAPAPDGLDLVITGISDGSFTVIATGSITSVPAGCRLLVYATTGKVLPKLFSNPSAYQPITYFEEEGNFTGPVNIFAAWQAHYGQLQINTRICIKTAVIDKSNGNRSAEFISCSITTLVMTLQQAYAASLAAGETPQIQSINNDGSETLEFFFQDIPNNRAGVIFIQDYIVGINSGMLDSSAYAKVEVRFDGQLNINSSTGNIQIPNLIDAVDDTAAAASGVSVDGLYRNGSVVMIRVT